jgi:hypothetical protein
MDRRVGLAAAALAGMWLAGAAPALAEEPRPSISAPMILNLISRPVESPDVALSEAIRSEAAAPPAARPDQPEVLPDGSVRYGRSTVRVIIKDCPETSGHYDFAPRPLPGRRPRP